MSAIDHHAPPVSGLSAPEGFMEAGLAIAAAAFTFAIWLSPDSRTAQQVAMRDVEMAASGIPHVTLPTVYIVVTAER